MIENITDLITEVAADFVTSAIRVAARKMQPYGHRVGVALWRTVRSEVTNECRLFRSLSLPRKAFITTLYVSIFIPVWMGLAMGDSTPYAVQVWGGSAILVLFGGMMWRAAQWGTRRVRSLAG